MSDEIQLTSGGQKKLGSLISLQNLSFADAIRERGGGQAQVSQIRSDYTMRSVADLANLAATGDSDAETAIKILKQAKQKRDKYGGK